MNNDEIYNRTLEYAMNAHKGQMRDDGVTDFIIHPIRVANMVGMAPPKVVALLHDVIEDSDDPEIIGKTVDFVKSVFDNSKYVDEVIEALEAITKKPDETKIEYYERVAGNKLATYIKIYDRIDNLNDMKSFKRERAFNYAKDSKMLCGYLKCQPFGDLIKRLEQLCNEKMEEYGYKAFYHGVGNSYVVFLNNGEVITISKIKSGYVIHLFEHEIKYIYYKSGNCFVKSFENVHHDAIIPKLEDAKTIVEEYARSVE